MKIWAKKYCYYSLFTVVVFLSMQRVCSQQLVSQSVEQTVPFYISPNFDLDTFTIHAVSDLDTYVFQANIPIGTSYKDFTLGAGYLHTPDFDGVNFMVGCTTGKFRISLIAGYYETLNRTATYGGTSFSYHHQNGVIGITVADVFDVAIKDGDDSVFYNFEAMTPQVFAKQKVLGSDLEVFAIANISYQDVESFNYRAALEFTLNSHTAGIGYSERDKWMAYTTINLGKFHLIASFDGNIYGGIKFQ